MQKKSFSSVRPSLNLFKTQLNQTVWAHQSPRHAGPSRHADGWAETRPNRVSLHVNGITSAATGYSMNRHRPNQSCFIRWTRARFIFWNIKILFEIGWFCISIIFCFVSTWNCKIYIYITYFLLIIITDINVKINITNNKSIIIIRVNYSSISNRKTPIIILIINQ